MPTINELRDDLVAEMGGAVGAPFSAIESDFEAGLATAIASAVQPHLGGGGGGPIAEWNESDVSQFTQVRGNGVDGVGSPGDWVLTASTFPGSDVPAIAVTCTAAAAGEAIWTFDATPTAQMLIDWWATVGSSGGAKKIDLGLVFLYADIDHLLMARQWATDDLVLWGKNGASGDYAHSYVYRSVGENNTVGDRFRLLARAGLPSSSLEPYATCRHEYLPSSDHGVITRAGSDADWLSLGTYAPKMALYATSFGAADTEYTTFRVLPG